MERQVEIEMIEIEGESRESARARARTAPLWNTECAHLRSVTHITLSKLASLDIVNLLENVP